MFSSLYSTLILPTVKSIKTTPVKNQAATGTCWSFATTSFMETELLRMGKGEYDLSEMFIVRQKYFNQAEDNYLRRGHGNVGQGSLSHTWMNAFKQVGIVPEEVYSGINYNSNRHNHGELSQYVNAIAQTAVKLKKRSPEYYKLLNSVFDIYLGPLPETFQYNGNGGYLNMSESFVRAKTIYVMLHKDALPKALRKKLGL